MIQDTPKGAVLHVVIQPKAAKTEVIGPFGEPARLKIRVAAPPIDGAANDELLKFLRKILDMKSSNIQLLKGEASKFKTILFLNTAASFITEKLQEKYKK